MLREMKHQGLSGVKGEGGPVMAVDIQTLPSFLPLPPGGVPGGTGARAVNQELWGSTGPMFCTHEFF